MASKRVPPVLEMEIAQMWETYPAAEYARGHSQMRKRKSDLGERSASPTNCSLSLESGFRQEQLGNA
jgi:hypothetical protein